MDDVNKDAKHVHFTPLTSPTPTDENVGWS